MDRRSHGLVVSLVCWLCLLAVATAGEPGVTTIGITDKVLVKDTMRLGINLGGDAYYSGAALVRMRSWASFEGTSYRQCHFGPVQDEHGATTWFGGKWGSWDEILKGAKFTILSGPARGISGTIKDVSTRKAMHQRQMKDFRYFVFDRTVPPGPPNVGVLVESFRLRDGQLRPLDGYWCSKSNRIAIGDVPPGSFGCAAACLDPGDGKSAHLRFSTHYQRYGETNGTWHVRFWAKAKARAPRLTVTCDRPEWGESKDVALTPTWKQHDVVLVADKVPEPTDPERSAHLLFRFEAAGGAMLLDDVEIWMEGDTNPTAFRDDCVAMLRRFNPGVVRYLQMGGSTLDNTLAPPLRSHAYTSRQGAKAGPYESHVRHPYSLHQLYELCEHLGCDPWYCLPGTLHKDEMAKFMEYLGAPPDTGYGKLRAQLGHPKPWTEVFDRIHVEFGNEAWNNAAAYQCGGFNGSDYWQGLIATGKSSKYCTGKVVFHAAGQAANSWLNRGIVARVPNADRFSVAPYILHDFSKEQAAALDTPDKLFRWAFAYPVWRSRDKDGAMFQNHELTGKAGQEMSIYEVNHHITGGDGPLEPRNQIVTSIGGGLNVANNMLLMLKDHGLRAQCLFALAQHSYKARGVGPVRLWGTALCMRKGRERYRPTFLACAAANHVLGGDLVETVHAGADPAFAATGVFSRRKGVQTIEGIPTLWSYAFADGRTRGLILISLDTSQARPVELKFDGEADGGRARSWLLAADSITANNEYEAGAPQVTVREEAVEHFRSGHRLSLPPHSMRVLRWTLK